MKVINIQNGQSSLGIAVNSFSSERMLIANPNNAYELARRLLIETVEPKNLKSIPFNIICHPLDSKIGRLANAEKMIFTDFAQNLGAQKVFLIDSQKELTKEELLNYA